jgi:hypothetical protein
MDKSHSYGYKISAYTRSKAKKIGVTVRPSTRKGKKIDVFKNGKKIAIIGAIGYKDYPTFIKEKGKAYADERRRLYHIRHAKDKSLNGYYAKKILW